MAEIRLQRDGLVALLDDEDLPRVSGYHWHASMQGYACAHQPGTGRRGPKIAMHRLILDAPSRVDVDHANGNRLDNRRCNLRLCTRQQNTQNRPKRGDSSRRFKGVKRFPQSKRWFAAIFVSGKNICLGGYETEEDAARAYDAAARKFFGPFARVNFPNEGEVAL